jgi:hypothetical protein
MKPPVRRGGSVEFVRAARTPRELVDTAWHTSYSYYLKMLFHYSKEGAVRRTTA